MRLTRKKPGDPPISIDDIDPGALLEIATMPYSLRTATRELWEQSTRLNSQTLRRKVVSSILFHGTIDRDKWKEMLENITKEKIANGQENS